MPISGTNESKNGVSGTNEAKFPSGSDITWDEATFTWNDATGTWDIVALVGDREDKNSAVSGTNEAKN